MVTIASVHKPVCSVCIANYNGAGFIAKCLDSVLTQDFAHPLEIILHDDASTDESVSLISQNYPQVRLVRSDSNVGYCVSNNRMVAEARGEFILLLNNDAALHTDALRTLHEYASNQETQGILGLPQYDMQTEELIDIGSRLDIFLNPIPHFGKTDESVGLITGACFWIPRSLWDELGGFPEYFGSLAEDLYLCCLARLRGHPVVALPTSGFDHWVGRSLGGGKVQQSILRTTYRRRALSERNKTWVMVICYPFPFITMLLPLHLILLSLEGILISLTRKDRRPWKQIYMNCFSEIWKNRKWLIQVRYNTQQVRTTYHVFFHDLSYFPHKLRLLSKFGTPELI